MTNDGDATYIVKDTEREHFKDNAGLDGLILVRLGLPLGLSRHLLDVSLVFEGQFIIGDNCIEHNLG